MLVGSVNPNTTVAQQQPVKKNNAKRTAAYIAAGLGTAAAIGGAVVYRKNISKMFSSLKDKLSPSVTNLVNNAQDMVTNGKNKVKEVVENARGKIDEGVEYVQEQAGKAGEKIQETAAKVEEKAEKLIDDTKDVINSENAQNIKNEANNFFKKTGEYIKEGLTTAWEYTKQAYTWVKDKVSNAYKEIKTFLSNLKQETQQAADAAENVQ